MCEHIHDSFVRHWCLLIVLANLDVIVTNFPAIDWDCWRVGPCRFEVVLTFVEQLVLPFFLLVPIRWVSTSAAVLEVLFQLAIVATGNYVWINWVGMLPCIALFDDDALAWFYRTGIVREDGFVFLSTSSLFKYSYWQRYPVPMVDNDFFVDCVEARSASTSRSVDPRGLWGNTAGLFFFATRHLLVRIRRASYAVSSSRKVDACSTLHVDLKAACNSQAS